MNQKGSKLLEKKVSISGLLFAAVLTLVLVKSLSLLPERYYFGFAKSIAPYSENNFLISPPHVSPERYGEILEKHDYRDYYAYLEYDSNATEAEKKAYKSKVKEINSEIIAEGAYRFWTALFLKILPPFVCGFLCFFIWKQEAFIAAPMGASLTAFLLCWPVISLWDIAVYESWREQKYLFFLLYLAYIFLYYSTARLGCALGKLAHAVGFVKASKPELDLGKLLSNLISTGITVAITWIVTTAISKL